MYRYRIYGLTVSSELECPFLISTKEQADTTIRFGLIPPSFNPVGSHKAVHAISNNSVLADFKGIAKYLITNGMDVLIEPYPSAKADMIRLFLLGSALGILLHQRGMLPLHGCGIVHNDKAILFLGDTGIGKSTLATGFLRKGYKLLTDDISAIFFSKENVATVFPAYPMIKLLEDTAKNFNIPTKGLAKAHPTRKKYAVPIVEYFCADPKPLDRIYILQRTEEKNLRLEPLQKIEAVPFLKHHTYRKLAVGKMGLLQRHINQCAQLADNYPIKRLYRPDNCSVLMELADFLEREFT